MKHLARIAAVVLMTAAMAYAAAVPRLLSTDRSAAKAGDVVVAEGKDVGAATVTKLFLTANGKDIPVEIKEQTAATIRFVIPADTALGTYRLMVQTAGETPMLMEQPVIVEVATAEAVLAKEAEEKAMMEALAAATEEEKTEAETNR